MIEIKIIGLVLLATGAAVVGWNSRSLWSVLGVVMVYLGMVFMSD